jgi:transposase-like protein
MRKRYPQAVKDEVLGKISGGPRVSEVAREHGLNDMTVRSWPL